MLGGRDAVLRAVLLTAGDDLAILVKGNRAKRVARLAVDRLRNRSTLVGSGRAIAGVGATARAAFKLLEAKLVVFLHLAHPLLHFQKLETQFLDTPVEQPHALFQLTDAVSCITGLRQADWFGLAGINGNALSPLGDIESACCLRCARRHDQRANAHRHSWKESHLVSTCLSSPRASDFVDRDAPAAGVNCRRR